LLARRTHEGGRASTLLEIRRRRLRHVFSARRSAVTSRAVRRLPTSRLPWYVACLWRPQTAC